MWVKILSTATLVMAVLATGCGFAIYLVGENGGDPKPHIVLGCGLMGLILATTITAWVSG